MKRGTRSETVISTIDKMRLLSQVVEQLAGINPEHMDRYPAALRLLLNGEIFNLQRLTDNLTWAAAGICIHCCFDEQWMKIELYLGGCLVASIVLRR